MIASSLVSASLSLSLSLPLSFFVSCQSSFVSRHRASPHCRSFWHEKSVTSDAVAPAPVLSAPLSSSGSFWQSNSGKLRLLRMVEERCEHHYWGKVKMVSVAEMRDWDQKNRHFFQNTFFGWWDFLFVLRTYRILKALSSTDKGPFLWNKNLLIRLTYKWFNCSLLFSLIDHIWLCVLCEELLTLLR